ncbi:hypothetical protein DPMN_133160 [Dreissena polymorpha]|uniref:EGF-like domain-containing protein n=1 Tax=Dreissena polymorpha TaxID=45954 RepID=A0A9D4FXC9_DREPO|nr:hypothetical protein DPMN_133160 [Dreissena polymorpha]
MKRLFSTAVLLACLTTTVWACTSDTDCDYWNPICDFQNHGCTRARCTTDSDCGSIYRCNVYSYMYNAYGNATGLCEPIYCNNNEMCPKAEHVECYQQNTCNCEVGYRWVKDRCESVIGTSCQWDWSCGQQSTYDHTTNSNHAYFYSCEEGKCGCNPNVWRELNGKCVSSKGKACDLDSDCGFASNTTCVSGICSCEPGFLEQNGTCVFVWDIECLADDDCGISFVCNESKCTCPEGYGIKSMNEFICVHVLDTPCDELAVCDDPSLKHYKEKLRGSNYYYYGYSQYTSHFCDVENICSCAPGFRRSTNGHACQPIYGSTCTSVEDCQGDSAIYSQAYTCSNDSSTCECQPNYMVNMRSRYTGTYHENINMCLPKIGSYCYNGDVDGASCVYSDNPDYSYNYGYSPRLTCTSGVEEHGTCRQIIGSNCSEFGETCSLANAICDPTNVCACEPGYLQQGDTCVTALNNTICASSVECSNISHATCDITMTFTCVCEEGYVEKKGSCVLPSSFGSGNCNVITSELPDLYRRSPTYKLARGEVPIRDDLLLEGWYDIGGTNALISGSGLTSELCGTKYPIVLKDDLTAAEKSNLAAGLTVTKTMTVKGLDSFGLSKEITVEVKICGDRTLLYLKPAPVAFSAYCIDTRRPSHAAGNSTSRCAKLRQEMRFKNEYDPNKETYVNVPFLMFKCLPMDENSCNDNYYYYYNHDYENNGVFFTINWYVSGRHCKRSGPYQKSELYKTHLTENQVIDECGQKTVGFDLQCSFEWSETLFGLRGTPIFSDSAYVGLISWVTTISPDKGGFLISWLTDTPIGCKTDISNLNRSCSIEWDLESGGICPTQKSSSDHFLCGANGNGTTKAGFDYYGRRTPYHNEIHYSNSWGSDLNGIYHNNYTTYGVKVFVSDDEVHEVGSIFKASFGAVETGHAIWNGYKMPDIKFYLKDESLSDKNVSLVLKWDGGPVLEKTNEWNETTIFPIEEVGEFLLYQSTDFIVEIQIKTRTCKHDQQKSVCVRSNVSKWKRNIHRRYV